MNRYLLTLTMLIATIVLIGCETAPKTTSERQNLESQANFTVEQFKGQDPSLTDSFFEKSSAYAVFPSVGKGGLVVGGAYGRGVLYEGGKVVGYCDMSQASIGLQAGGQGYSQIIFFQNETIVANFKKGGFALSAQATAVAAESGAGAQADYKNGVAVFLMGEKGLMAEASVAGQRFDFVPKL